MQRLKSSSWAMILFWVTIISAVIAIADAIIVLAGMESAIQVAREAAQAETGADAATIELAMNIARGALIAGVVVSLLLTALVTVGGLKFSMQGKWGTFCVIIGILSAVSAVISLVNFFRQGVYTPLNIVTTSFSIAINVLFFISSIMLKIRDKNNAI